MMQTQTVSFVPAGQIIAHFVPEDWQDAFREYIGADHSWGDTWFTLIGNNQMFHYLLEFLDSINTPLSDEQQDEYWALVGYENFVNLEE